MSEGISVPKYAYLNAKEGLRQRKEYSPSERPVLSVEEANMKGVHSGVTTARTLIRSYENDEMISEELARRAKNFLSRTHGQLDRAQENGWDTGKILVSIRVWGGQRDERFREYLQRKLDARSNES